MRPVAALRFLFLLIALPGCGPKDGLERAQITGLITNEGQPLAGTSVQFVPAGGGTPGAGALGVSDAQGKFEVISSREDDAGLPPGEYIVIASRWADPDGKILGPDDTQADHPNARETVPPPFSGQSSPLRVTIKPEGGEVKVDIPAKLRDPKKMRP